MCVAALARLGAWPARADELLARAVLPPDAAATLRAVHLARSGHQAEGLARLRDIATRTVLAAVDLVDLIDQDLGTDQAIAECQRQRERWRHHPGLSQRHASLLERAGRGDEAADLVRVADQRPSHPRREPDADLRLAGRPQSRRRRLRRCRARRPGGALAENFIHAAHAACRYSWSTPPSRSHRRT